MSRVNNSSLADAVDVVEERGQGERQRPGLQQLHGERLHRVLRSHLDGGEPEGGALAAVPLDEGGERARLRQALHHRVEEASVAQVRHPPSLGNHRPRDSLRPTQVQFIISMIYHISALKLI